MAWKEDEQKERTMMVEHAVMLHCRKTASSELQILDDPRAMEAMKHPAPHKRMNTTDNKAQFTAQADEAANESSTFPLRSFPFPRLHNKDIVLLVYHRKPLLCRGSSWPSLYTTIQIFAPTNPAAIPPTEASNHAELSVVTTFRWLQHGPLGNMGPALMMGRFLVRGWCIDSL
ncbi:hypothetical protein CPC08DRAFT_770592 [Agrocybe pediades]|nr:hypothetical protein CPC08DRAFT_770592 [Agrocybe pediades]